MIIDKIQNRTIQLSTTIIQSLKKMDNEHVKLLFVFNNDKFEGILTIGDVQRAILANIDLSASISTILSKNKEYAQPDTPLQTIKERIFQLRAECMPVVDCNENLVNVYFWNDFFGEKRLNDNKKINIPVVIMAGGVGTRLKPLTNVIPKPLIPIGEKTIVETIMNQFEVIGCNNFYMSVNYKSEILEYYFNTLPHKYNIEFFKEDKPLGTIGSVRLLEDKIHTTFFVSNCDIIIDQDYRDVYDYHIKNKNDITIVAAIKSYQIPYGVIETGKDGIMTGLSEKPEMTYMINTGVYILQPELIKKIPKNQQFHITHLMEKVKNSGGRVGCFPVSENSWTDVGDWNEYAKIIRK